MEYEHRIICFIDILAFKNIINKTVNDKNEDNTEEIQRVHDALQLIRDHLNIDKPEEISKSKIITQFSDSIVISFLIDETSEIFYTLLDILNLTMNFLYRGILVRGGIAYGKLIHTDNMLFGPGMITAYETESKAAMYPRIILDKTVIEIAKLFHSSNGSAEHEEKFIMDIVTKDTDEMYYIDYIKKAQSELDEPDLEMPTYISKLRSIIELNNNSEKPDIKVKIGWLINKYNLLINDFKDEKFIEELRESGNQEFANYYSELKKIE